MLNEILNPKIKNCANSIRKSENSKIAIKIGEDGLFRGLIGSPNFSSFGKQKFSVKILQVQRNDISIGVALDTVDVNSLHGLHGENNSWMVCFCCNGDFYGAGRQHEHIDLDELGGKIKEGDVVSVEMDMDSMLLQFYINAKPAGPSVQVLLNSDEKPHLAPAIDLRLQNDSVEFI